MKRVKGNADRQKNVEVRGLVEDSSAREQPLEILEQKVPVFEKTEHAQVHANAGNQPCPAGMAAFGPGHLSAKPKIHRRGGKKQCGEWRVPRAVKNVACDYEKIFSRVPGTNTPVGGDDDYKKDDERERIEKHYGRAMCLFKSHVDCQYILPDLLE